MDMWPGWETELTWDSLTRSPPGSGRLLRRSAKGQSRLTPMLVPEKKSPSAHAEGASLGSSSDQGSADTCQLPLAMGLISGKDEIAQFVALADCHKADGRRALDAQTGDGQQPLQEHVGFLNGKVRARAAMVSIAKAHQHGWDGRSEERRVGKECRSRWS